MAHSNSARAPGRTPVPVRRMGNLEGGVSSPSERSADYWRVLLHDTRRKSCNNFNLVRGCAILAAFTATGTAAGTAIFLHGWH